MNNAFDFFPEWASPPGATLRDILSEREQSIADFAKSLSIPAAQAKQLIGGSLTITEDVAKKLAQLFGLSAEFWLTREFQYREQLSRFEKEREWLRELPLADFIKLRWIPDCSDYKQKLAACLQFFGVQSVAEWHSTYEPSLRSAAFRKSESFAMHEIATLAWLRKGELEAGAVVCADWNPERFRQLLPAIRRLTREKDPALFIPKLQKECSACGVAVVIEKTPSGCTASGAVRFLKANRAVMMLSFRHLSDDHFWFTFFHEAAHLLLHDLRAPVFEGDNLCTGEQEKQANQFAMDMLVPPEHQGAMKQLPVDARTVMRFARQIDVSPGVIVGQMQHLGLFTHRQLNNLKTRYKWDDN